MIFVCLGTKRFSFNRLLKQIDQLKENGEINKEVFAQIGNSTYLPKNYQYTRFLSPGEYTEKVNQSELVITHGGTGAIIKALKAYKQVVAVPRREIFGEHSDDHQLQIVSLFEENGYIRSVEDMKELSEVINQAYKDPIKKKFQGKGRIVPIIEDYIEKS